MKQRAIKALPDLLINIAVVIVASVSLKLAIALLAVCYVSAVVYKQDVTVQVFRPRKRVN